MKSKSALPSALMHGLLASVVYFMSRSGMNVAQIENSFRDAVRSASARKRTSSTRSFAPPDIGSDTVAGAVLRAWHREKSYIDEEARPIPLRMAGSPRGLAALMRRQDPKCDVRALTKGMLTVGLIRRRRNGEFLPVTESATIRQLHPLLIDHVAKSVMRLVETVYRNTDPLTATTPMIERYAHVPDLDSADAEEFATFAQQQGAAYLEAIDDWLETRRIKPKSGKKGITTNKVAAGVHLVAYLGDQPGYRHNTSARSGMTAQNLFSGA